MYMSTAFVWLSDNGNDHIHCDDIYKFSFVLFYFCVCNKDIGHKERFRLGTHLIVLFFCTKVYVFNVISYFGHVDSEPLSNI